MKQWMSIPETAARWGMNPVTLWRAVRDGKIMPDLRLGNRAYFETERVEREARKQAVAA